MLRELKQSAPELEDENQLREPRRWAGYADMLPQIRSAVESEIRTAFRGITLGRGISLRQAQFTDSSHDAVRSLHSAAPAHQEITDDWLQPA